MKLGTALSNLQKGAWSSATAYLAGEFVTRLGSTYMALLDNTNFAPETNPAKWQAFGSAGPAGAVGIEYSFDTTTTNSDPGAGKLRLDNATQNIATTIRADLTDSLGSDMTALLDTLDDATSPVKGAIMLVKKGDPSKFLTFNVTALATPAGYRNITVVNTASSAANPFANNDAIQLLFARTGDATVWRDGTTVPANSLGSDGDYYMRSTTGDVYKRSGGTYSLVANIGGPVNARRDEVKTTASLADQVTENGVVTLGKSFLLLKIVADRNCRVRLYSTAAARTADASRPFGTDPTAGTQHGVICDLLVTSADSLTWILSPQAPGSCMEASVTRDIPYAIQNLSGATSTVQVTFTVVETEA